MIGRNASEAAAINFPRLPVRERDHVFVWFAMSKDASDHERRSQRLLRVPEWRDASASLDALASSTEVLRLAPTLSSRLHG